MVEVVAHDGRLTEGRAVLIVVADIEHAFLGRIVPDLLIQLGPIGAAFLRIDLPVQLIQLRVVLMDPVEDVSLLGMSFPIYFKTGLTYRPREAVFFPYWIAETGQR